jgi:hypothetical protein
MDGNRAIWRKSSYSGNNGGNCVEVAATDRVMVRDTKDRTGPVLRFDAAAWRRFAEKVKRSLGLDLEPNDANRCRGHSRVESAPYGFRRVAVVAG